MISSDIINFSNMLIYTTKNNMFKSLLSIFLLNIYLMELDLFILKFSAKCNFRKNLRDTSNSLKAFSFDEKQYFKQITPIKLENSLFKFKSLRIFYTFKSDNFNTFFKKNLNSFVTFDKYIFYCRYINHILLGFISSKNFVNLVKKKIDSFIRSSLHFDIKTSNNFIFDDKNIVFCGFNIRLINVDSQKSYLFSSLKVNKKFASKISSRILSSQRKIIKNFSFRFQDELFFHIDTVLKKRSLKSLSLKDYRFWTYIFQLEAIRSAQFDKLILTGEKKSLISEELFTSIKYSHVNFYENYSFNLYISKLQIILKETINNFSFNISNSVVSTDFALTLLVKDFRKKLFILYNNLYSRHDKKRSSKEFYPKKDINFLSSLYNNYSFTFLKTKYSKRSLFKDKILEIFIPFDFCVNKLKLLGFVHPTKITPVSSRKFLSFDDLQIIKYFGYIAFTFLTWYRCCYDFSKLKFLVNIIRQSCFLTLCRKHNKSKSWAYSVYTPDLIIFNGFYINKSFFPSRKFLLKTKRRFFYSKIETIFNEEFFLTSYI
jgi:hypothetical protein